MAKIPGKQILAVGTREQLLDRLSDNEPGICITDHGLYTKMRGKLVALLAGGGATDSSVLVAYPLNDELIEGDDDSEEYIYIPVVETYRVGSDIWVDEDNQIRCNPGLYHVDARVVLSVDPLEPRIDTVDFGVYDMSVGSLFEIDRSQVSSYYRSLVISGDMSVFPDNDVADIRLSGLGTDVVAALDYLCISKIGDAPEDEPDSSEDEPLI